MVLHTSLPVYRDVYQLILKIFEVTKDFSKEYKYTLGQDMKRDAMQLVRSIYRANKAIKKTEHLDNFLEFTEQRKERELYTVEALVMEWYSGYIEKHRAQPKQIKQLIDADIIPLLGKKKLETIQTKDVTQALDKIVTRGSPVHANKVLAALKQAFGYGVRRGNLQQNPAESLLAKDIGGAEKPRERHLTLDEIKILWLFLDSDNHALSLQIKNAIKIILLTGVRTGELRIATWSEFDFEQSLWIIPAEHTKTNITMRVHLSDLTKQLLLEMKQQLHSDYVLPGADGNRPLSDKALPKAILRIQTRIGIPQWTPHDLRRTLCNTTG